MLYIKVPLWYMSALWRDCLRTIKNGDQSAKKELLQPEDPKYMEIQFCQWIFERQGKIGLLF